MLAPLRCLKFCSWVTNISTFVLLLLLFLKPFLDFLPLSWGLMLYIPFSLSRFVIANKHNTLIIVFTTENLLRTFSFTLPSVPY